MVPKPLSILPEPWRCFRAVLFRMVPKPEDFAITTFYGFRAVLFRMVPKQNINIL